MLISMWAKMEFQCLNYIISDLRKFLAGIRVPLERKYVRQDPKMGAKYFSLKVRATNDFG